MLLSTVLSWVLLGVSSAVAPAEGALPVYFSNVVAQFSGLTVFEAEAAPAVLSHFRGDGKVAYSASAEQAVRMIPSTFMDERNTAILIVDGFNVTEAEPHLGSPVFYLSDASIADVTAGSRNVRAADVSYVDELDHPVLRLTDARPDVIETVLHALRNVKTTKVMLIGLPESRVGSASGTRASPERRGSLAQALDMSKNISYIQIPDFFDSAEDCDTITNSCAGHGNCAKGTNGKFMCKCVATRKGDYTYYWGGNDCSKRDVSFQANMLVGTTIAIIAASALSIGLLFRLGSEPLPGILLTTGSTQD